MTLGPEASGEARPGEEQEVNSSLKGAAVFHRCLFALFSLSQRLEIGYVSRLDVARGKSFPGYSDHESFFGNYTAWHCDPRSSVSIADDAHL